MKVNIILFDRGAGGNFLARVLTLDPSTVCLGKNNIESAEERCNYYCYENLKMPPNTPAGNGLSVWVDQELNHFYFPFSRGFKELAELNKVVIEPIHPDHYNNKLQLLGHDDSTSLYYIDTLDCESWVTNQFRHKISQTVPAKLQDNFLKDILNSNIANAISLRQIINSELTFLDEYVKICDYMQLNSYTELALRIYRSWKKTWG